MGIGASAENAKPKGVHDGGSVPHQAGSNGSQNAMWKNAVSSPTGSVEVTGGKKEDEPQEIITSFGTTPGQGDPSVMSTSTIPFVFNWNHGGNVVYITGTFNGWKMQLSLHKSEKDFTLIQNLPPGVYQYKFIVDGKWRYAPDQPTITDPLGNINNVIEIKEQARAPQEPLLTPSGTSPPGPYTQESPLSDYSKEPPALPPHLQKAILNAPSNTDDPSSLPLPHHVVLNHLYARMLDKDVMILGATQRYNQKFVTTLFYKPVQ